MRHELTQDELKTLVTYNPETGEFVRIACRFKKSVGVKASSKSNKGYLQMSVKGENYNLHRLAWLYVHGSWPTKYIDHIDGNRENNRIANLREATNSQNQQNIRHAHSNNKSGYLGVTFAPKLGKWKARIKSKHMPTHIGYYATPEEAHKAYLTAKKERHPFGEVAKAVSL